MMDIIIHLDNVYNVHLIVNLVQKFHVLHAMMVII
jgi:hypothetical protein